MKIAIVIERIESWRGGAETSTMELARLLAGRGHEVHLLTSSRSPSLPDLTIHMLTVATPIKPLHMRLFVRRAARFIEQHPFDIVHAIAPLPQADVYQARGGAVIETLQRNVATRRTFGGRTFKRVAMALNLKQRTLLDLERRICRPNGPIIAAVSQYVADQFARHYDLRPPRVRVIYNGVQVEPASPEQRAADRAEIRFRLSTPEGAVVLLCVAHNFRLKGVARLIDALAELRRRQSDGACSNGRARLSNGRARLPAGLARQAPRPPVPLPVAWIVGRDNPAPFQRQAQAAGVSDSVIFAGPTQRIAAFFHASDVCVHPTYYDPCSRVVLEALSHGVPPITTAHNGAAEAITPGRNGLVIPSPDDVSGLADAIQRFADPVFRASCADSARQIAPQLTMRRHVAELAALFEEIADRKRRPV